MLALILALTIDPVKSTAAFSVSHVWVENVTGTVPIVSGSVDVSPGSAIPTSVTAVLDPSKVKTDEPDRDNALRSPDFFDVQRYPAWTFVSTKITPEGPSTFEMDGNLTIHGVTQPERLAVTASGDPAHPRYRATCDVDRHAFGMATTRLDPVIGTTVHVTLDIVTAP
jgi:polyisoprenoid-binding protein YceI